MNSYLINDKGLDLFQKEFWKDKRKIELLGDNTILKHYDNLLEQQVELSVIKYLRGNGINNVPEIMKVEELSTLMTYHKGMRVFNFLVALDKFFRYDSRKIVKIRNHILERCATQQRTIQFLLNQWNENIDFIIAPYPFEKFETVISLLSECLQIKYDKAKMKMEKIKFSEYWNSCVAVPFRDSTTKNMIIDCPTLYLENFKSEEERDLFLLNAIQTDSIWEYLKCPIIDIDFSSCLNLTSIEDDIISLYFHERTWNGHLPTMDYFNWNWESDNYRVAMTFIMRFLRLGGRKAAYKIFHKDTYKIRFKYDNPYYYFHQLPAFVSSISHNAVNEYNELFKFIDSVAEKLKQIYIEKDYFKVDGRAKGELAYGDVFPL